MRNAARWISLYIVELGRLVPREVEVATSAREPHVMASRLQSGGSSSAVQRAAGNAASGGGVPYTVLSSVAVRSEAATTSAKVDTLAAGVEILVLEKRVLQDGTVRLRFSGGWISEKLKKTHKVLAAPTDSISSEAKPPSAGCADASSARQAIAAENAKMREELAQVEAEIAQTDSMIDKARAARKSPALSQLRPTYKQEHAHLRLNSAPGRVAKRSPVPNQRAVRPRSAPVSSQARTAYKALAVGVIRRGPELTSAKVATLEVGQAVEALEKRTLKDGTVRLRLKAGWVSKVAKVRPTVSRVDNYNDMPVQPG